MSSDAEGRASWPSVDWSRYNLQLLFVDRTGVVRSRFAAGIFERIAEWNGWSRAIIPASAGLHSHAPPRGPSGGAGSGAEEAGSSAGGRVGGGDGGPPSLGKMAAVFSAGHALGLVTRLLARPAEAFDWENDLEYYDLVLVLDTDTYDELLSRISPEHLEYYKRKLWKSR
ncbi:hypothetical protein FOA52_016297 [Chlamydomonas sp. UWO 241]|nr:hypothetical protein FOA52_016297 [Chlamydomonas sp. UWO 241]